MDLGFLNSEFKLWWECSHLHFFTHFINALITSCAGFKCKQVYWLKTILLYPLHDRTLETTWYVVHSISFQTFFVQAFKIVVDFWKFSMLLLYILWDDWPIFMISASNKQLQQQLEYTLLKLDRHSWWISKMQSGCEDTL